MNFSIRIELISGILIPPSNQMKQFIDHTQLVFTIQDPLPADDKYPLQCVNNLECADVSKYLSRKEMEKPWSLIVQGDRDRFPREIITMDQIASKVEGKLSKLVVIKEGRALGGGKTTLNLSWELCRQWANGEVWTDYSLVVLLRLRECSGSCRIS